MGLRSAAYKEAVNILGVRVCPFRSMHCHVFQHLVIICILLLCGILWLTLLLLYIPQITVVVALAVLILLISDRRLQTRVQTGLAPTHRILGLLHRHLLR